MAAEPETTAPEPDPGVSEPSSTGGAAARDPVVSQVVIAAGWLVAGWLVGIGLLTLLLATETFGCPDACSAPGDRGILAAAGVAVGLPIILVILASARSAATSTVAAIALGLSGVVILAPIEYALSGIQTGNFDLVGSVYLVAWLGPPGILVLRSVFVARRQAMRDRT